MATYYDQQILDTIAASDRPLRHREIADRVAPGDAFAWSSIGNSLTHLYRAGRLAREKIDGRYWHYTPASATPPLLERLANLLTAARAYRDARQSGATMEGGPISIGPYWERLKAEIDALDAPTS